MTKSWDRYRKPIIGLYKVENRPLHEVKKIMEESHGFVASTRAYRTRLDKWRISKYNCHRKRRNSNMTDWSDMSSSTISSPRSGVGSFKTSPDFSSLQLPRTTIIPRSPHAGMMMRQDIPQAKLPLPENPRPMSDGLPFRTPMMSHPMYSPGGNPEQPPFEQPYFGGYYMHPNPVHYEQSSPHFGHFPVAVEHPPMDDDHYKEEDLKQEVMTGEEEEQEEEDGMRRERTFPAMPMY